MDPERIDQIIDERLGSMTRLSLERTAKDLLAACRAMVAANRWCASTMTKQQLDADAQLQAAIRAAMGGW